MNSLPKDNVFDIFSRIQIKDLSRLRAVCKDFNKYNNDPYLEDIRVKDEPTPITFQQLLGSNPNVHCQLTSFQAIEDAGSTSVKVKKDQVMDFWHKDSAAFNRRPTNFVLGSCNGLVLFSPLINGNLGATLAVINPQSKQLYELPPIKISSSVRKLRLWSGGIGFDYSTNTFKVVCVVREKLVNNSRTNNLLVNEKLRTMVHDLRSGLWKEIAQVHSYPITGEGVFSNGCLHWLVESIDYNYRPPMDEGKQVVRFNVKKEEFELIDLPKREDYGWINEQLVDLNGDVGYVYNDVEKAIVQVWILKGDEWVHLDRIQSNNGHTCVSGCWNKEGDLLFRCQEGKQMFVYDKKTRDLKEVDREEECEASIRMYRNSLLSIHGFNSNAYSIKC
ncbi:F-box protein CPR1-like [Rutidosis leptorrhynchoides]|uniref:F-box protein CPR1-like n=1 Tax=Rutidosis leptorrhynchoides TaxID=125765 RepID=UPI003A992872